MSALYPASGVREITLTQGRAAFVDAVDYDWLVRYKWQWWANKWVPRGYANHHITVDGIERTQFMHRLIMDAPRGMQVDHINGDGLDNRRVNLRLATVAQNQANRGPQKNNTSGYKGVMWDKANRKWKAAIIMPGTGRNKHLGRYALIEDAARAYNDAARLFHGEFAYLNPVPD